MRLSLLTRVSLAFCLVVLAAVLLLWTHIAMQKRIMARFKETQVNDVASLRKLTDATKSIVDYRHTLLNENRQNLIRSLRLSTHFAPTEHKIRADLTYIQRREPLHEAFQERRIHQKAIERQLDETLDMLKTLPERNEALLQALSVAHPADHTIQQRIGAILVTLDSLETNVRAIHRTITARYQASGERLARDQQRAANVTTALFVLTFLAFLIAVGTIWKALAPIGRLTAATAQVGRGEFDIERIDAGNDEIGQLASAFHGMTQALASRDHALRVAQDEREAAYGQLVQEQKARISSERLAVIGALSARITHELRNPLSSLSLNIEMILDDPQLHALDHETQEMLRAIQHEIERLESLSTGYLNLAHKPQHATGPVDFSELVQDTIKQFQRTVHVHHIDLSADITPHVLIEGDAHELRSVLINLIENARIALENRPPPRRIDLTVRTHDTTVVCVVEDNGPGVAAGMEDHLFDAFHSDRPDGTGLGLNTAQRIIEAHHGTLQHTAPTSGGARFTITLPRLESSAPPPSRV